MPPVLILSKTVTVSTPMSQQPRCGRQVSCGRRPPTAGNPFRDREQLASGKPLRAPASGSHRRRGGDRASRRPAAPAESRRGRGRGGSAGGAGLDGRRGGASAARAADVRTAVLSLAGHRGVGESLASAADGGGRAV